jgi:DNA replication protein DnaC
VPSISDEVKHKAEIQANEDRLRLNAISRAIDNCEIPWRYRGMDFKDFKVTIDEQRQVLNDCQDFMVDGNFETGLMMIGKNGTGKTMLACIVLQELIVYDPNNKRGYRYAEAIKIIRDIKDTWRKKTSEQEAINKYIIPKVLVIDEIGMSYGSPTEKQFLTEIINDRYNKKLSTILAGNLTSIEIKEILGDRIFDRFCESGKSLVFKWDSHRQNANR